MTPLAAVSCLQSLWSLARRREPHVLHLHWGLPNGVLGAVVAKLVGVPAVVSLHGSGVFMGERHAFFRPALRAALASAASTTACSGDLARRAVALGARPEAVTVIPYGVDTDAFRPGDREDRGRAARELDIAADRPLVLAVGRLVAKKGFGCLVDAASRLAERGLKPLVVIAGGGDLRGTLERRARDRGVEGSVRLLGPVNRETVRQLYRASDVLAVPSVRDAAGNVDGLPNVLMEGMASGLPVVASRLAGIPDVVHHGENGLLVPPGEPAALAEALERLLRSPRLRERLGTEARQRTEARFTWEAAARRYRRVLERAAERAGD